MGGIAHRIQASCRRKVGGARDLRFFQPQWDAGPEPSICENGITFVLIQRKGELDAEIARAQAHRGQTYGLHSPEVPCIKERRIETDRLAG